MVQTQPTLKGKTVAVTRPCGQADEEAEIIRKKGGKPYLIPTIEIQSLGDLSPIKKFIEELRQGGIDYIVFMSVNGIKHLLSAAENLKLTNQLEKGLKKTTVIAVGPRTAQEIEAHGVHVNLVPEKYTSDGIAESMQQLNLAGKKVAIPRTSAANPTLKQKLTEKGALVQEVYVYNSAIPKNDGLNRRFVQDLASGKIHAIVFGSGLCAKNFFQMLSEIVPPDKIAAILGQKVTVLAIGPVTAEALAVMHVKVDVMPKKHTFEEAIAALAEFWQQV
jgi:uroporphyrinogen-III synthase